MSRPIALSKLSPKAALQRELQASIALNERLRKIMTTQLEDLEKKLEDDSITPEQRLNIVDAISRILANQSKAIDAVAKHSAAASGDAETEETTSTTADLQAVLAELKGKR